MALESLSDTRAWELVDSDQDLRGRNLWDSHGNELGVIDDMVIDTDTERVASVVLKNGDEFVTSDLSVSDDAVYVLKYDAAREEVARGRRYEEGSLRRRAPESTRADSSGDHAETDRRAYNDFTDDFRRHYDSEFGHLGRDYSDFEPAYRFGYDMAFEPGLTSRDFEASEEDLRQGYYQRMGYPMSDRHVWDDVKGAVRRAFERAREERT